MSFDLDRALSKLERDLGPYRKPRASRPYGAVLRCNESKGLFCTKSMRIGRGQARLHQNTASCMDEAEIGAPQRVQGFAVSRRSKVR